MRLSLYKGCIMNKEYGGYLPIELPKGNAYYYGDDVIALNAGRYAVVYALQDAGWKCIYLPFYICSTVEDAIRRYLPDICIKYYHIDEHFLPMDVSLQEDEGLLWVNYWGVQPENVIDEVALKFRDHLIIDNTQAFFTAPREMAYQVYSCRKFFGVCDGSYVIHKNIFRRTLKSLFSSLYAVHLLHSLEYGTNYSYALNKENEERLNHSELSAMSPLTSAILGAVDYSHVLQSRRENMAALHQILKPYNQLHITEAAPAMAYPFLCSRENLREVLVEHKVYVPKLWAETAQNQQANPWEVYLSEHLCILPVDQRYTKEDMNIIGNLVLKLLNEN